MYTHKLHNFNPTRMMMMMEFPVYDCTPSLYKQTGIIWESAFNKFKFFKIKKCSTFDNSNFKNALNMDSENKKAKNLRPKEWYVFVIKMNRQSRSLQTIGKEMSEFSHFN